MSSNLRQAQVQLGRSSFYYEADTSQDSIYEDPTQKRQGTNFDLFTFLNDINVKNVVKLQYDNTYFAYFSKISLNGSNQYVCKLSFDAFPKNLVKLLYVKNLYYFFVSVSPTCSEHIYEEIPERTKAANEDRPLPPIPETSTNPEDQNTKV